MIHPTLIAIEKPPQSIAIHMHSSDNIPLALNEIMKHTSIKNVTVVIDDDEEEGTKHGCEIEIQKQQQQQQQQQQPDEDDDGDEHSVKIISCTTMNDLLNQEKKLTQVSSSSLDVVILFPDLDDDDDNDDEDDDDHQYTTNNIITYWHKHLSSKGVLVTYLGPTLSLSHIDTFGDVTTESFHESRYDHLKILIDAKFERIIDYDIPLGRSYPMNVGIAFKSHPSMAYWRLNEPLYNLLWAERTNEYDADSNAFDGATMMTVLHPPKHSALSDCSDRDYDKYGTCDFHGYDPQFSNVRLDQLYVAKSHIGDNAGRGVFTNVDIVKGTNVGLETTVYSIVFDWVRYNNGVLLFPISGIVSLILSYLSILPSTNPVYY
jgi:hypothetical protein